MALQIRRVRFGDPAAQRLIAAALDDLSARYGGDGDGTPVDATQFDPPHGGFFVATVDGEPVGCGGWRTGAVDPSAAEIKRMYTAPAGRRNGVATAILAAIEHSARAAGRRRVIIETGTAQPEAIALYQRLGYAPIEDFGYYKDHDGVRSFGRDL